MPDPKTYVGTCHCGKVKFEATLVLESAMDCNCSIDSRTAAVMAPVPAEQFELVSGEGWVKTLQQLISGAEIRALTQRARRFAEEGRYPEPTSRWAYPWPLI